MSKNRTLLITGASSGIGAATARMASAKGWNVALGARSEDRLETLARELGENAVFSVCDVTKYEDVETLVEKAKSAFGGVDAVFANAGRGVGPGGYTGGDPEEWKNLIDVNVLGLAYTIRASADALKASKGRLIITSSIAGRKNMAGSVYGATKWAASAMGDNARAEFKEHGVSVTLIEPGMVDTAFFDEPKPDALKPEDVGETVLFALERPAHVAINELIVMPFRP